MYFLMTVLLLITACSKEVEVVVPAPLAPPPTPPVRPEPIVEPLPPPPTIPDVPVQKPAPEPMPEPKPPANSCTILKKIGTIYTPADVGAGKITLDDYNNLRKCYPYFGVTEANTQAVCCII